MNEELSVKLLEWLQGGEDFIVSQAPDLVRQIILSHQVSSVFYTVVYLITSIVTAILLRKTFKKFRDGTFRDEDLYFPVSMLYTFLLIFSFIGLAIKSKDLIDSFVAPKMVVVEHIAGYIPK